MQSSSVYAINYKLEDVSYNSMLVRSTNYSTGHNNNSLYHTKQGLLDVNIRTKS